MVRINLLPAEIRATRERGRQQVRLVVAGLVVAFVMVGLYVFVLNQTAVVRAHLEDVESEHAEVEAGIASYAPYVELQGAVSRRGEQISDAMGASPDWMQILLTISRDIPGGVWLTDLRLSADHGDEEGGYLHMQGYTYDHPSTARWLEGMEEISHFADVRCSFTVTDLFRGLDLVRFEMSARVPGKVQDPLKVGGGG